MFVNDSAKIFTGLCDVWPINRESRKSCGKLRAMPMMNEINEIDNAGVYTKKYELSLNT